MKRLRLMAAGALLACGVLALGGCQVFKAANIAQAAADTPVTQSQADAALNTVLALKASWVIAEKLATAYALRPICGPAQTAIVCSNPKLVAQLGAAAPAVSSSINAAESAARQVGVSTSVLSAAVLAAQTAYSSYQTIMAAGGIKQGG